MLLHIISVLFMIINLPCFWTAEYGFDSAASCGRDLRKERARNLPCNFNEQSWCTVAGATYPWHAVRRFVQENHGLMRRMYGDERHISVLRKELLENDIEVEDARLMYSDYRASVSDSIPRSFYSNHLDAKLSFDDDAPFVHTNDQARYMKPDEVLMNTKFTFADAMEFRPSDLFTLSHFRTTKPNTNEPSTTIKPSTVKSTILKKTSHSDSRPAFTKITTPKSTTFKPVTSISSTINPTTSKSVTLNPFLLRNTTPRSTISTTSSVQNYYDVDKLPDPIPEIYTNSLEANNIYSINNLTVVIIEENVSNSLTNKAEDESTLQTENTTVVEEATTESQITEEIEITEEEKENSTTLKAEIEQTSFDPNDYQDDMDVVSEGQLFQDTEEMPKVPMKVKGVNACPVKEEVVAPFWANNTRGEVLALLNLYPFEQYVHWERCASSENRQMYCRKGCRCEQQYRLHRLLAYDPSNECRGIFSDWFRFPSCCVCTCYDIDVLRGVTSRSPRIRVRPDPMPHPRPPEPISARRAKIDPEWYRPSARNRGRGRS